MAWYRSYKSQSEDINGTKKRIEKFYDILMRSGYKRILIVSHGYFLRMFYEEMKKRGFKGEIEINIQNAKLYTMEN
jgi:broad specificity phosphatase PhoE